MFLFLQRYLNNIIKSLFFIPLLTGSFIVTESSAQQMMVDDAEITTYRSFQIETWFGTEESWFLTAFSPLPVLELGTGLGFDSDARLSPVSWFVEAKFVPGNLEANGWADGIAGGALFDFDGNIEEIYGYFNFSRMMLHDNAILHINTGYIGWQHDIGSEWEHELLSGIRGDFTITDRLTILSEAAAINFEDYFLQGGIRVSLVPDLIEMDITYAEGFRRMESAPGLKVGIAFTPGQVW